MIQYDLLRIKCKEAVKALKLLLNFYFRFKVLNVAIPNTTTLNGIQQAQIKTTMLCNQCAPMSSILNTRT